MARVLSATQPTGHHCRVFFWNVNSFRSFLEAHVQDTDTASAGGDRCHLCKKGPAGYFFGGLCRVLSWFALLATLFWSSCIVGEMCAATHDSSVPAQGPNESVLEAVADPHSAAHPTAKPTAEAGADDSAHSIPAPPPWRWDYCDGAPRVNPRQNIKPL